MKIDKTGGYTAGTRLLCNDGMIPIEFMEVGEQIITRDAGTVRIEKITRQVIKSRFVKFLPGALGRENPMAELVLPADQIVLVRDWRAREVFGTECALVEARTLVDDMFIVMTEPRTEILFQVSFQSPHIVYLEGAEVGSSDVRRAKDKTRKAARHDTAFCGPLRDLGARLLNL